VHGARDLIEDVLLATKEEGDDDPITPTLSLQIVGAIMRKW